MWSADVSESRLTRSRTAAPSSNAQAIAVSSAGRKREPVPLLYSRCFGRWKRFALDSYGLEVASPVRNAKKPPVLPNSVRHVHWNIDRTIGRAQPIGAPVCHGRRITEVIQVNRPH